MVMHFAIVSDTHFYAPGSQARDGLCWNRVLQTRSDAVGQALVETVRQLRPDFVVHCGDITGLCELTNYDFACHILDSLGAPWYAVLGNHDTWYPGVRDAFSVRFGLPPGHYYYSRDLAGFHFLFLDVASWYDRDGHVSPYLDKEAYDNGRIAGMGPDPEQLVWLESELAACDSQSLPAVLVSHAPLAFRPTYPVATLPKGRQPRSAQTAIEEIMEDIVPREAIAQMIARHPCVQLALAGHWHIHDVMRLNRVTYCQTASLREYPFEIRIADYRDGILAFRTVGLHDATFREWSYVPEWRNDWLSGTAGDRTFEVLTREW